MPVLPAALALLHYGNQWRNKRKRDKQFDERYGKPKGAIPDWLRQQVVPQLETLGGDATPDNPQVAPGVDLRQVRDFQERAQYRKGMYGSRQAEQMTQQDPFGNTGDFQQQAQAAQQFQMDQQFQRQQIAASQARQQQVEQDVELGPQRLTLQQDTLAQRRAEFENDKIVEDWQRRQAEDPNSAVNVRNKRLQDEMNWKIDQAGGEVATADRKALGAQAAETVFEYAHPPEEQAPAHLIGSAYKSTLNPGWSGKFRGTFVTPMMRFLGVESENEIQKTVIPVARHMLREVWEETRATNVDAQMAIDTKLSDTDRNSATSRVLGNMYKFKMIENLFSDHASKTVNDILESNRTAPQAERLDNMSILEKLRQDRIRLRKLKDKIFSPVANREDLGDRIDPAVIESLVEDSQGDFYTFLQLLEAT